jgi:hypothetical protein
VADVDPVAEGGRDGGVDGGAVAQEHIPEVMEIYLN